MNNYLSLSIHERINYTSNFAVYDKLKASINELNTWGMSMSFGSHLMPFHKSMDCNGYYC